AFSLGRLDGEQEIWQLFSARRRESSHQLFEQGDLLLPVQDYTRVMLQNIRFQSSTLILKLQHLLKHVLGMQRPLVEDDVNDVANQASGVSVQPGSPPAR